jgi:probable F420-dependent oxidoreductase
MKLGVLASVNDRSLGIADLARQIEGAGLESLFLTQNTNVPASDDALLKKEYHHRYRHLVDPFVALGAAAAVTTRIRLGTGICVALLYDPIILAVQVATLDQLSSGRFVFGIGVGHDDTVQNHGVSPELRHRVLREKVLAMKAIWAGDNAEFHGEFADFGPILTGLRPHQQPHPPILIGSQGGKGIARTVEYADGWMPIVYEGLDFGAQMHKLEQLCQTAGRPTAPVTAGIWEIDEPLMERCAELGVDRCIVVFHAEDKDSFPEFLKRYSRLVQRFGGPRHSSGDPTPQPPDP